ncbi:MAG: response regulator [Phycisphaerales bacterium]|nr:response regulator [Phycisphaerales bacterium]
MSEKKSFGVGLIGIPDNERNVLKNIFKLSLYRPYTYSFAAAGEPIQILLVDGENPEALAEWRSFKLPPANQGGAAPLLTVLIAKEQSSSEQPYFIRRPFVATRVLTVLDQAAGQLATTTTQERVIGGEAQTTDVSATSAPLFTALVVDDSSTVRKQVELELKLLGIHTDTAESGEEAFTLLSHNDYDIIFLDVILPGVDGYQICKTIKKNKAKKKTPVIMLTSKSSPFDRVKGALAGCDTYLTKPAKQNAFQKVVKKYLNHS